MNFKLPFIVLILSYVLSPSMGQVGSLIGSGGVPAPKQDLKNIDGKPKMDQSTSLMASPGQPVGLASRLNQLEAEFREKFEEIKAHASRSTEDQEEKIAIIRARERNLAQLLNQTREEMVVLKIQNREQSKRIDQLEQKVAILQNTPSSPPALTRGNNQDRRKNGASQNNVQAPKPSTPPSSCQELAMLDYSLDGLYLVKNQETKKIQTVFCKFSADNKVVQEPIGTVDVKTKTVHFYVQKTWFTKPNAVIPFELARLNEGSAFHLISGIFTVPVKGIYHFDFSALKNLTATVLSIYLQVNGVTIGTAYTDQSASGSYDVVSLSASLQLAAGDRVNLYNAGSGVLVDNGYHHTHFTGWLVDEDLM